MRRALLHVIAGMVLAATVTAPALVAAEPELEGTYLAKGVNADGSRYTTLVQIASFGESFLVMRMIPEISGEGMRPRLASIGIGVLNGNVLAVSDYSPETARILSYRIEEDGRRLVGRWTFVDGNGTVHEELLTKVVHPLEPWEVQS